ncbi:MAG TPA: CHAT domain-containing tetratricopeptide repeat protein [Thermoanaerobaculia bacterium]
MLRRIVCALSLVVAAGAAAEEAYPFQGMTPPRKIGGMVSIAGAPLPAVPRGSVRTAIRVYEPILAGVRIFGDSHTLARGCGYLATLYAALGDMPKAKSLFDEAQAILEKHGGEGRDLAWVYNNRGLVQLENREHADALRSFRKAVAILDPRREEYLEPRVVALENLASTYQFLGDAENSESAYLDALEILRQLRKENTRPHQVTLSNLALLYCSMGDYEEGRKILEKLAAAKGLPQPLRFGILNNLGQLLSEMKLFAEAEARLMEAQSIASGEEQRGMVLMNRSMSYWLGGKFERAAEVGQEALHLMEDVHGGDSFPAAIARATVAAAAMSRGELVKADRLFVQARNFLSKEKSSEDTLIFVLRNLALVARRRGQHERALAFSREALALSKKHLERILAFGTETQRLAYLSQVFPYDQLADLGEPELLADAAVSMKGAVLESLLAERAMARKTTALADREQLDRINALKVEIMEKIGRGNADVDRLERELKKEQTVLTKRLGSRPFPSQSRPKLSTLQAALRDGEVLVEVLRYQRIAEGWKLVPAYGALVVSGKDAPRWVALADADALDPRIERLLGQFDRGGRGTRVENPEDAHVVATLRELHDLLWKPLVSAIPGEASRILLSPDGATCFLPWAALLDDDGDFLAERWQLTQLSAGRDLLRVAAANDARGKTLLALADGGEDLPHSRNEVMQIGQAVEKLGWRTTVLLGRAAAENDLQRHPRPGILHLATHAGQLRGDAARGVGTRLSRNPMYRGYLVLGGGKDTLAEWQRGVAVPFENDGILTAEEASGLDLNGTWLTVLSACETGAGDVHAGEGVLGLRRGFAMAGTKNLLFSLWPVRDDATAQFMTAFYDRLFETADAASAFHETQVAELRRWRSDRGVASAAYRAGAFVLTR